MNQKDIDIAKGEVAKSLEAKLSSRGDFTKQMRRAKRHMPRKSLEKAHIISQAEANLKHPRLRKLVDKRAVAKAKRDLIFAVEKMDPAAQRAQFWYSWGANLVVKLLLGFVAIYCVVKWLGNGFG